MEVTNLSILSEYAKGQMVQFPDFGEGQTFVARIKRPSLLALVKTGKIPNSLLSTASELFAGKGVNDKKPAVLKDLFGILDTICESCFMEPTYNDLKEAGVELTDEQLMFIFNYTQRGVKALEPFRKEQGVDKYPVNEPEVPKDPS